MRIGSAEQGGGRAERPSHSIIGRQPRALGRSLDTRFLKRTIQSVQRLEETSTRWVWARPVAPLTGDKPPRSISKSANTVLRAKPPPWITLR